MTDPIDTTPAPEAPPADDGTFMTQVRQNNQKLAGNVEDNDPPEEGPEDNPNNVNASDQEPKVSELDLSGEDDNIEINPISERPKKEKKSKEDNIRGLRKALSSERTKIETLELDLKDAKEKLEQSGDVEQLRSDISERDVRIEELTKYESLLGLKSSKEFKEKYVDGVNLLVDKARDIAKDYEVSDEILTKALQMGNRKQLNELLLQHFDTVTIGEIVPIIRDMQDLLKEKKAIEDSPAKAHDQLIKAADDKEKTTVATAHKLVTAIVQEGWTQMVNLYNTKEGGVEVLQEVVGDDTHNENRAGLIKTASKEYGQLMGSFVQNGLRKLPEDQAQALAARFQLAAVAGQALEALKLAEAELAQYKSKAKKSTSYRRPMAAGSNSTSGGEAPPQKIIGKDIAAHVFTKATQ